MSVIVSILVSIVLSGCSKSTESDVIVKTSNINQSPAVSANGNISANNNVSANYSVSVNPSNAQASSGGNGSTTAAVNNDKKSSPPVNAPTPQVGSSNDFSLFTQARVALNSDKEFIDTVIIEIKEGNVVLTGNVSSEAQKTKAGQLVQAVKGIKSVKNNLRVAS
jgi:osmotically-inducible protein OsmY